jgi:alanine racemase
MTDKTNSMEARNSIGLPRVLVSRTALIRNVRVLRRMITPGVRICAVVKADAYGHGAELVVDTLGNFAYDDTEAPAVDSLAVATIEETASLPETLLPILILRPVENAFVGRSREAIELAIHNGWILTITSSAAADDVARLAMKLGRRAIVHVMIDTGMTRTGAAVDNFARLAARIASHGSIKLAGVATHLANGEVSGHPFTAEQLMRFRAATDEIAANSPRTIIRHAANSGGTFFTPDAHFDMVRCGIAIYGIDPTAHPCMDRVLRPALRWTAPLAAIHDVRAGTGVGYGQTWRAPHDTRIGVVPVGYADGYLRAFSNRAVMLLGRHALPVVGRVSMDYTCIDLHDAPEARLGDDITVLDSDPLSPASAYELARLADTIPYELFTRIGPRVARVAVEPEESRTAESLLMEE